MDAEIRKELDDLTFVLWAARSVTVNLLADKLEQFKDPKKAAELMASRVYENYDKSKLSELSRIKLSETIISILDEATNSVLLPRRKPEGPGKSD